MFKNESDYLEAVAAVKRVAIEIANSVSFVTNNICEEFEYWVNNNWHPNFDWESDGFTIEEIWQDLADEFDAIEVGDGDISYPELIYTADIYKHYLENSWACDDALAEMYSGLGEFSTIDEAVSAAVHTHLAHEVCGDLNELKSALENYRITTF